jgi:2-isopropylmalate synthase
VCRAIDRVVGCTTTLADFQVQAVTEGLDSVGSVTMRIENAGRVFSGRSASTDIIVASAQAYLSAVNRMLAADEAEALPAVGTTPD